MKILCSLSSLEFNVDHFPGTFHSRECYHPIFNLPQKRLLGYLGKWGAQELTTTDSYLLFLAILRSSDLLEFRVPVMRTTNTDSIIAQNMESLSRTVIKLNTVTHPGVHFPHFVISPETRFLANVHHWIESWAEAYADYQSGSRRDYDNRKLLHRELALERMLKNPHKSLPEKASSIAEWASLAGSFPEFLIDNPLTPTSMRAKISCADYWKSIIVRCAKDDAIFAIPKADILELLEHVEENVPYGSIQSNALFSIIRRGIEKQKNFLGLGDLDLSNTTYQILSETDTAESANVKAMIDSAPVEEPSREAYPTKFAYLRARMRWNEARKIAPASGGAMIEKEGENHVE